MREISDRPVPRTRRGGRRGAVHPVQIPSVEMMRRSDGFRSPLRHSERSTFFELVLARRCYPHFRVTRVPGMYEGVFLDDRGDMGHPRPFSQRHEFHADGDLVPRGVGLVGKSEAVHDLARPGIFNLQRLVILQSLVSEPPENGHVPRRVEVVLESTPMGGSLELVSDISIVEVSPDGRREVPGESEIEGEDVLSGLHRVVVRLFTGEERPFVGDDGVIVMVVLGRRSAWVAVSL